MNSDIQPDLSASAPRKLTHTMQQRPLLFYFLLAYAISWILVIPYILAEWHIIPGNYTIAYMLHTFGPSLSALIVTRVIAGKGGLQSLRERIRQVRAGWQWYLFILAGIPTLFVLGMLLQPGALAGFQGLTPRLLVSYPIYFVIVFFGGGPLGEEIGWRGFALPRMQPRYGSLKGTLLLGLLWTCWHLPDFLTASKGGGPGTGLAEFLVNFPVFLVMVTSLAVIFTWLFNHTRGSIFIAILAHASVNTPELTIVPLFTGLDMISLHRAGMIAYLVPALLILLLTRGKLGFKAGVDSRLP